MTFSSFVKCDFVLIPSKGIIKSVDACSKYMLRENGSLGGKVHNAVFLITSFSEALLLVR
jgi:hypothetical protein